MLRGPVLFSLFLSERKRRKTGCRMTATAAASPFTTTLCTNHQPPGFSTSQFREKRAESRKATNVLPTQHSHHIRFDLFPSFPPGRENRPPHLPTSSTCRAPTKPKSPAPTPCGWVGVLNLHDCLEEWNTNAVQRKRQKREDGSEGKLTATAGGCVSEKQTPPPPLPFPSPPVSRQMTSVSSSCTKSKASKTKNKTKTVTATTKISIRPKWLDRGYRVRKIVPPRVRSHQ